MGKVLTVINVSDIQRFRPTEKQFMLFDSVVCPNVLHFAKDHVEYEEWLAKMTYCAKKHVYLEMAIKKIPEEEVEHSFGEKQIRLGGYTPITYRRLSRRLADMGFSVNAKWDTGSTRGLVRADRMERIPYSIHMRFMDVSENVVVSDVPIDHSMWDDLWPLIEKREKEYHTKVRDLRTMYKVWMDEPIWFAKWCRVHIDCHFTS